MASPDEIPAPPNISGLSWRSLQAADAAAIAALASRCLAADGGHPFGAEKAYIKKHYLPARSTGAFEVDGRLTACAAVRPAHTPEQYRASIVGLVHPDYRRRGIGAYLLGWSIAEAGTLLASSPPDRPHVLQITTESLTDAAASLFERHEFSQQFTEDVMRRDLALPIPDALLPSGLNLAVWAPGLADQFFAVYLAAFRERPGFPDWSQETWMAWLGADEDDFHPELSLLACHDSLPLGFIVCADKWIVQMGVHPDWRKRGIASALVTEVLRRFRDSGGDFMLLDVNTDNPRAARVYARLGFQRIGKRARYERAMT